MLKDFRNHFESLVFINDVFECYLDFEIDKPQSNLCLTYRKLMVMMMMILMIKRKLKKKL